MPSTSITPNSIDRNANSANRQRRNWQRLSQGAATATIKTSAPITGGSTVGLSFLATSGLGLTGSALAILFADASIVGSASGIKVQLASSSALSTTASGLKVLIDGSTITLNSTGQLQASTSGGGGGIAGSTQLATTAPLAGGGVISTGLTLSIPLASSTANGYLSSTDWTTFNSKGSGLPLAAADGSVLIGSSTGSTTVRVQLSSSAILASTDFTTVAQNTSPYAIGGNGSTWYVCTTNTTFFGVNTTVTSTALIVANVSVPRIVQRGSGTSGVGAAIYVPTVALPGAYNVTMTGRIDQPFTSGVAASLALIARANTATHSATEGISCRLWTDQIQLVRHDTGALVSSLLLGSTLSANAVQTLEMRVTSTNLISVLLNGTQVIAPVSFTANSTNTGAGFAVGSSISSTDGAGGAAGVQTWSLIDLTQPSPDLVTSTAGLTVLLAPTSGFISSPLGLGLAAVDTSLFVGSTGVQVRLATTSCLTLALTGLAVSTLTTGGISGTSGALQLVLADSTLTTSVSGVKVGTLTSTNLPADVVYNDKANSFTLAQTFTKHIVGGGTAPTIAAGTGAGTGPTLSISGTDTAGIITLTAGTSPATSAVIATATFATAYATAPFVDFSPANKAAATLSSTSAIYVTSSTTNFILNSNTVALTAATQYIWNYIVVG